MIAIVCVMDLYQVVNGFADISSTEKGDDEPKTAWLFWIATHNLSELELHM